MTYKQIGEKVLKIYCDNPEMNIQQLAAECKKRNIKVTAPALYNWARRHNWEEKRKQKQYNISDVETRLYDYLLKPDLTSQDIFAANKLLENIQDMKGAKKEQAEIELDISLSPEELEQKINIALQRAVLRALNEYANNPSSEALSGLLKALKAFEERFKPHKRLKEYLIKFLKLIVKYFESKGMDEMRESFQAEILGDNGLAEYLLRSVQNA